MMAPWWRGLRVVRSGDYSALAGSLATVAIASLGGPLSAAGAALAEVVKLAQARYEAGAPTRDLRRQVTAEIRQWAEGEKFASEDVRLGLALATETVARFGLDYEAIAALKFDPKEVVEARSSRRRRPGHVLGDARTTTRSLRAVSRRPIAF